MIILHVTDIKNKAGNGVAIAVTNYAYYQSKNNTVGIYNLDSMIIPQNFEKRIFGYKKFKNISELPEPFNNPDLVIFNEVYKFKYLNLYKECKKKHIKFVIIPHGCLVSNAQKKKKIKKKIGNILFFNKFIRNANAVQFLNDMEKENSNFKYKKYIISGNGIDFVSCGNNIAANKNLIYIGRYSIDHKGLDLLVNICTKYKLWFVQNNIKINLYGRDSGNDLLILKKIINDNGISNILIINDAVYDSDKKRILEQAYAFIQTSRYEGQPMGIIEALGYGLPCIVTFGTSFGKYVNEKKCGYGVNFDEDEVFRAIKKIYNSKNSRDKFSKNAKKNAIKDFEWQNIINDVCEKYSKLI